MALGGHGRMVILLAGLLAACARGGPGESPGVPDDAGAPDAGPADPGALVRVTMQSQVGVLLDEIPAGMRERVAQDMLGQGPEFWTKRAVFQIEHTLHRLVYRQTYYADSRKRQLPLPPRERWNVTLDANGAERMQISGHDMVVIGYTLDTLLLSDAASPGGTEPALARVGGTWDEAFVLPVDPMLLFQRTGYACMDVSQGVFEENARWSFDHTCDIAGPNAGVCHRDVPEPVTQSCIEALDSAVGKVETAVRFERLAWDAALADSARAGTFTRDDAGDLEPLAGALENHWLVYRYIEADSCAVVERCVASPGWRRLLMFDASVRNVGGADMHIGLVDRGLGSALIAHNVYEYSPCHGHYHFRFYGDFRYGTGDELTGMKQAFCLQSTQRHFNDERTSLITPYYDCSFQGISAGWGDDYLAGLDCQWLDVTDFEIPGDSVTDVLSFEMNPDGFLCEGDLVEDDEGYQVFEPTTLVTEDGERIDRPVCDQAEGWNANNLAQREVEIPRVGSFIQKPCPDGALGPGRDCGFADGTTPVACTAGETVTLACQVSAGTAPHVARFCEVSQALGIGVACVYRDAVASAIVTDTPVEIAFPCPVVRDAAVASGGYSMYTAPLYGADAAGQVTCVPQP
jgi:hypothetical protein